MNLIATSAPRTMTSLEISEVVQSRHDDVRRSIERLADRGVISLPPAAEVKVERERRTETVKVYLIGQRDSYIIVAQLSPEFTAALVDRWQELEAKAAPALPDFSSPAAAARAWADQFEARHQAEAALVLAAPKVAFVERYVEADTGSKGFRQVAKLLKANEARFREFLLAEKILYRLGGEWVAHQHHADAGRFEVKTGEAHGHAFNRCLFTPRGVEWIAGEWAKFQIRGVACQTA